MFSLRVDDEVSLELAEMHHAQELYDLTDRNREHLRPWMPWEPMTKSVEDTKGFLTQIRNDYAAGKAFHCNLRYRGAIVGGMGLHSMDFFNRTCELGYWIDAAHSGKGIVTRATRALVTAAFAEYGFERVAIQADVDNARSRAVPERLGFTFEGTTRAAKRVNDRQVDSVTYAMLAADWDAGTLPG
jgi:ribosomal-protein-serine acetyltransferase